LAHHFLPRQSLALILILKHRGTLIKQNLNEWECHDFGSNPFDEADKVTCRPLRQTLERGQDAVQQMRGRGSIYLVSVKIGGA